jgi:hypothetical protein
MTLSELQQLPIFKILDKKEQAWVIEYCKTCDPDKASREVFKTATDRAARIMTRRMMTEPRVVPVIAAWNGQLEGEPTLDEYRHELWRMARECRSDSARAALMRLYGETRGFIRKSSPSSESPAFDASILDDIENPKPSEEK